MEFGLSDVETSWQTAKVYRPILPRERDLSVQINEYGLAQGRLPCAADNAVHPLHYGPPGVERGDSPQGLFRFQDANGASRRVNTNIERKISSVEAQTTGGVAYHEDGIWRSIQKDIPKLWGHVWPWNFRCSPI